MTKERVLFVGTVSLDKLDSGKKVFVAGIVKYFLDKKNDFDFFYYQIAASTATTSPNSGHKVKCDHIKIGLIEKIWNVICGVYIKKTISFQEALLSSPRVSSALNDFISDYKPTTIIFDTIRAQQYQATLNTSASCILYGEDLFSIRYEQMIAELVANRTLEGVTGAFSEKIPTFAVRLLNSSRYFQQFFLSTEISRVKASESRAVCESDVSLYLNYNEVDILQKKFPEKRISFLPPYPVRDQGQFHQERQFDSENIFFLIVANWGIPQNVSGFFYVVKNCWPIVKSKIPAARLKIIGPHSQKLKSFMVEPEHGVEIAGWVDDLSIEYSKCCAALLPTTFGTGLKLKLIEALSFGTPVVSTVLGVSGTVLTDGKGVIACRNPEEFANAMCSLADKAINRSASKSSSESYRTFYSQDCVVKKYDEIFK